MFKNEVYRKVWIEHYGPIPKDERGKSFHIHHIDGDGNNNDISNLMCLSAEDHFKLHELQGDIWAPTVEKKEKNKNQNKYKCPHCGYNGHPIAK